MLAGAAFTRLQVTKWQSPWTPGHNCDISDWLALYIQHVRASDLWQQLAELKGKTLVCDCPMHQMCEADALIGLYFDAFQPCQVGEKHSDPQRCSRTVMLLQGINALPSGTASHERGSHCSVFSQALSWGVVQQFQVCHGGLPFTSFPTWLAAQGERWDGPLVPHLATPGVPQVARIGEGQQIGAVSHRAHFQQALKRAQQPLPFEETPVVDADLRFVASLHIGGLHTLRDWRWRAIGALRELRRRWSGVTERQVLGLQQVDPMLTSSTSTAHRVDVGRVVP